MVDSTIRRIFDIRKIKQKSSIPKLEKLNRELLKQDEIEVRLEYAWTGNLGDWYWDIKPTQ